MWRWYWLRLCWHKLWHGGQRNRWSGKRTYLECAMRGHPWFGDEHPGAGAPTGRCLCGEMRR